MTRASRVVVLCTGNAARSVMGGFMLGFLADVAPTILKIMGLDIPAEMTGKALI